MGLLGLSLDPGSAQIHVYSGNKAALVDILRKQENGPNFGGLECGKLENTQINLRIRMSVDDITFTQTVLYDGKIKI